MFIVALFIIVPNWRQPNYPSKGEWINKLWNNHTVEYQPLSNKNEQIFNTHNNLNEPLRYYAE